MEYATFEQWNRNADAGILFTISGMPVTSGQYWNSIHGRETGEAAQAGLL